MPYQKLIPPCLENFDNKEKCFANVNGKCTILNNTVFHDEPCPFYKTLDEFRQGQKLYGGYRKENHI